MPVVVDDVVDVVVNVVNMLFDSSLASYTTHQVEQAMAPLFTCYLGSDVLGFLHDKATPIGQTPPAPPPDNVPPRQCPIPTLEAK